MKVDAGAGAELQSIAHEARRLEDIGYDGIKVAELNHDPFLSLTLAAEHTHDVELITSVAVAFARNPMSLSLSAHDLNAFSQGRFILGLGSQVKPHIERRFSMPWHKAAAQMREFIEAMQAIYACWYRGERLSFEGEYYRHTLMPSTFAPPDTHAGPPRIYLSATGPLMTKVAAEVADGMIMHPFSTERYIREVTLPAIDRGLALGGRTREGFELDYAPIVATGATEEALQRSIAAARDRIAFYGSTLAYRPVLDLHGWGELQEALNSLNKREQKAEMASLIDDEVLHAIAIVGEPSVVVEGIRSRLGGTIGRTGFTVPGLSDAEHAELIARLKAP